MAEPIHSFPKLEIRGVAVQGQRLVLKEVQDLDTLSRWEDHHVKTIRNEFERLQQLISSIRSVDQSSQDQSSKEGEIAIGKGLMNSSYFRRWPRFAEEQEYAALVRTDGSAELRLQPSYMYPRDEVRPLTTQGLHPRTTFVQSANQDWKLTLHGNLQAELDAEVGILRWDFRETGSG